MGDVRVRAVFRGMQAVGLSILCGLHVLAGCGGSSDRNDATAGRGSGGSGGAGTGGSSGKGSGGAGGSSGQGSGGSSGAGTGGSSGNAGSGGDSCCPEDACDVGETLYIGSPPFDATTRRATACSCEAWCARLGGYPTCDAGDEQVSGPCPAEDGCYQRFYQAMYVWCRRAGGEGGAGGAGGEAGAAGAAGAP